MLYRFYALEFSYAVRDMNDIVASAKVEKALGRHCSFNCPYTTPDGILAENLVMADYDCI